MTQLNRDYLQRPGPTNVIAFSMREGRFAQITPHLLGDVVISTETAMQEAQRAGISLHRRLTELLVHGILHLVGFDHEKTEAGALRMEKKSMQLLEIITKRLTVS